MKDYSLYHLQFLIADIKKLLDFCIENYAPEDVIMSVNKWYNDKRKEYGDKIK